MDKKAIIAAVAALLAALGLGGYTIVKKSEYQKPAQYEEYIIERIIDGDTIKMASSTMETDRIRLLSINAPELDECYGAEAKEALEKLIDGRTIKFEKDISGVDKFGRLLRYLIIVSENPEEDNILANYYLIRNGYAFYYSNPPDNRYKEMLLSAEREAKKEKKGMWGECDYLNSKEEQDNIEEREEDPGPADPDCIIKGNISEKGYGKTYLVPGCDNYNRVKIDPKKGEAYFCTEEEAQAAGFRKATNCPGG